jgi:tetratricopeptide (TPR) repeat protein
MSSFGVNIWQEPVIIPTYGVGKPDQNPMFFEKRVYQGSSGVVYPNPVIEKIYDEKYDQEYVGLYLENKYLKIMILPQLGGRVQMAYDKIKERHFIYYNRVIKPALVGLTGPWISGGIEFNWPQHHRPSTFELVDYEITENADGSKTVWVNEVERMFGTKGMAGFTLHPDKAYLEIKAQLFNRTPLPQTFLWWANPAVKVNDDYQSIFPPDVNAVFDHGKRDVSDFPIATGTYYKVDYSPGTDISRYKNIPVPTSYMAINSNYDFIGGYEHDTRAGLLHVASHHVSPGKKQWTWGYGDFGQAWDRNLTDEDGPYIEIMTGVFTDNQPDFSWLMPYEEKSFTQYFLPYRELGAVKNANQDILLSVEADAETIALKVMVTSVQQGLTINVLAGGAVLFEQTVNLIPEDIFEQTINLPAGSTTDAFAIFITDRSGSELLSYKADADVANEMPTAAKPALPPHEVENNEQLFLTAQHLEQYRHANYSPLPYYEEALKRDDKDSRCNNALGAFYMRKGKFEHAEPFFHKAIETNTARNPNPYDGEPFYNLGLCLQYQNKLNQAYHAFYKATWSNAWKDTAYFAIAQINVAQKKYTSGLEHINQAIDRNAGNSKAWALKITILRKLGHVEQALHVCAEALTRDQFNLSALFEKAQLDAAMNDTQSADAALHQLLKLSRSTAQNHVSYALDYAAAGLYQEALQLLSYVSELEMSPLVHYYTALFTYKLNDKSNYADHLKKAAHANPYLCFPNRLEDIEALQFAMQHNADDAKAPYYLGNLWYDKRQYDDAVACWEKSIAIDDQFATAHRNLGIAYFNKRNDQQNALQHFEKAFALDPADARVLMELDQLYKRLNRDPQERLSVLEANLHTVLERDDLYLERVALYNQLGDFKKAYELMMARRFHPWEGGEGKVSGQYVYSLVELAKQNIEQSSFEKAVDLLKQAQTYPHNIGEGKLYGTPENDIFYWLGRATEALNNTEQARDFFKQATVGTAEPGAAMFYNDQQPDKIFYQGLAWRKLGNLEKGKAIFENLVNYGEAHQHDDIKIDYFAVSLPNLLIFDDDLNLRNQIHCYYIKALGLAGLGKSQEAVALLEKVLSVDQMHSGAKVHYKMIKDHPILITE